MKRVSNAVWLFSCVFALATHGAAVLVLAGLLHNPAGKSQDNIQLTGLTVVTATPVQETGSGASVDGSSDAEDVALRPVSSNADMLTEMTLPTPSATQLDSPSVAEKSSTGTAVAVTSDLIRNGVDPDTSLSEIPADEPPENASASAESPSVLAETPTPKIAEQPYSNTLDPIAAAVVTDDVSTETSLSEAPPAAPAENSPVSSAGTPELAETPAPADVSGSSGEGKLEQSNQVSSFKVEPDQPENATSASGHVVKEMPPATEQADQTGNAVVLTENTSSHDAGKDKDAPPVEMALIVPRMTPDKPQTRPEPPKTVDVLNLVEGFEGGSCFLALPEQDQARRWSVRSYSAAPDSFDQLKAHLEKNGGMDVLQEKRTIQTLQCGAINFAKSFATRTNDRLKIAVHGNLVQDGSDLDFLVTGFDQTWLYITMIDDDGIATDLSPYAKMDGGDVRLKMPVHINNAGKHRSQLLLAISSDQPLTLLDLPRPKPFAEVLPLIKGNIIAAKARVAIAIADFSVE